MAYIPIPGLAKETPKKGYIPIPGPKEATSAPKSSSAKTSTQNKPFAPGEIKSYPVGGYVEAGGYGASFKVDPVSRKPLLAQTNKAGTTLPDRTAQKFDVTKPQNLERFTTTRLPIEASQELRSRLGATAFEQLDHVIPLSLGGSNQEANLRLQATINGKQPLVNKEYQLFQDTIKGKISVENAWKEMAKAKGVTLQEDVPKTSKYIPIKFGGDFRPSELTDFGLKTNPELGRKIAQSKFGQALKEFKEGFFAIPEADNPKQNLAIAEKLKNPVAPYALGFALGTMGPFDEIAKAPKGIRNFIQSLAKKLGITSKEAEVVIRAVQEEKTAAQGLDVIAPSTRSGTREVVQGAGDISPAGSRATAQGIEQVSPPREDILPRPETSPAATTDARVSLESKLPQDIIQVKAIETTARQLGETPSVVSRVVTKVKKAFTDTIEYVQNTDERVRQLVNRKGVSVDDVSDPYLRATLYPGRVATKIDAGRKEVKAIIGETTKAAKRFKTTSAAVRKEVNDYLRFRHAPERNAVLGDGAAGVTTKKAQEGLKMLESSSRAPEIKALVDKAAKLNEQTLDLLKNSGVISDELYVILKTKYKNHVPLQRIFEDTEDIGQALSGKGFDVRSTGIKRAVGSAREVDDILANITANYEQAVLRSEKNIVDQATLAFARKNKSILGDLMVVIKPKAVGKTFDGKILMEKTNDPSVLQLFENGKPIWIKINDPALAIALRGVGREKLGPLLNAIGAFTRFYSGLATRFNPEFAFPNKLRDLQETAVYLASQKGIGLKGAGRAIARDPISIKNVLDYLRGADTPGARLYEEMKSLGGTTGGFGLSTKAQVKLSLEKMEKLANSKTRRIADNLIEYIDDWNTIFEDSTRLSVYKQALEQGLSKERAAFLAKEASINFNRMGRGGPVINALWMFSNASIQGSAKMIRALKNPKVLGATVLTVGGAVSAVNAWNDRVDPEWRNKVSRWDRLNGLPIVLPSAEGEGVKYITIPVSWGLKPIKVMSDYAYDAISGQAFSVKNMVTDTMVAIIEAYNPAGGSDLVSALAPTIIDIPVEIARNKSWSGSRIRPDYDPSAPADILYFDSLRETTTGRISISISELLQEKADIAVSPADIKYAYDAYVGGAGRATSKAVNIMTGPFTGELAPLDEYPFVSRFYREKSEEELGGGLGATGSAKEDLGEATSDKKRETFKSKEAMIPKYEEVAQLLEGGKVDEARAIVDSFSDDEYNIYKSLKSADKRRENLNMEVEVYDQFKEIRALVDAGKIDEAKALTNEMTDEEYEAYKRLKNKLAN